MLITPKGASDARRNSVRQLSDLYTVLIGISLTIAIGNVFTLEGRTILRGPNSLSSFAIFIVLLIPFYHGAVRHLFATYIEDEGGSKNIKSHALFFDYIILFFEGAIFAFLSRAIGSAEPFIYGVGLLLIVDSFWGFMATVGFAGSQSQEAEKKWAATNAVTVILLLLAMIQAVSFFGWSLRTLLVAFGIVVLRTMADYYLSWSFYFPSISPVGTVSEASAGEGATPAQ